MTYSTNGRNSATTICVESTLEERIKALIGDPEMIDQIDQIAKRQRRDFLPQVLCLIEAGLKMTET